jgi:ABC-type branched-subunit amino acid transport system permease subunit
MIFDGWASVGRVVVLAVGAYVLLVAALRHTGPQALTKKSAFESSRARPPVI